MTTDYPLRSEHSGWGGINLSSDLITKYREAFSLRRFLREPSCPWWLMVSQIESLLSPSRLDRLDPLDRRKARSPKGTGS